MDSELRRRGGRPRPAGEPHLPGPRDKRGAPASPRPLGWPLPLLLAAGFTALYLLVHQVDFSLPEPGSLELGARRYLRQLVSLGPRICGSEQNEVHAVRILRDQLTAIQLATRDHHRLVVDHQVVSGSFRMQSLDGVTSEYANVQNILARLGPAHEANHSVLVNCHFDTAIDSPGASDDAVSCAVMMEVLRRIALSETRLRHNIIFLFNGAEENMLQGAHGFITQHRWAWSVRAYINLEACGAGGRELVFQTGPGHPWLVKAYAEVVPHPFANIMGQEIFQSGIIPSDTDFRIFRDYGRIPGLDTAFIRNGYVYHTPFDDERQITAGSVQRAGENVEAMLLRLATGDDMVDPEKQEVGTMVFTDVLGVFMIVYPDWLNEVIAFAVAAVTAVTMLRSLRKNGLTVWQLLLSAAVQLFSWALAVAVVIVIATGLDSWNATMSWYAVRYWTLGLYVAPVLGTLITVQQGLASRLFPKEWQEPWRLEALWYETVRALLLVTVVALAMAHVYSSVLFTALLLFPTLVRSVAMETVAGVTRGRLHLALYVLSQAPPQALMMHFISSSTELFIPIMGRAGNAINPELPIGLLVAFFTIIGSIFTMSSLCLVRCHRQLSRLLLLAALAAFALVALTPLGFPYSTARPHIRAQRVWLQHVERTFRDRSGAVRRHDAGFLLMSLDRNMPSSLAGVLPGLETALDTSDDCETELYCGIPFYYPVRRRFFKNRLIPGPAPEFGEKLVYGTTVERRPDGVRRVHFNITGPDHMTMQLSPRPGVQLLRWSLADGVPLTGQQFQGRPTYFLYFSWGQRSAPWAGHVDLKVSAEDGDDYLLDAVLNGHHLHGPTKEAAPLRALLGRLPDWTVPVHFASQLEAFRV